MSTSTEGVFVPQWDLADRLAKALRVADVSVQQMADYLDVHRNTVSAWINGRTPPSTQSVRLWAMRTGVPYLWLKDGTIRPDSGPDGGGMEPPGGIEPPTYSL
ncbi:helix-turn-helix domain-containing protein, partial [Mycobacterium aquaticum]|uniref:helix-turn-helix domain-containing protein n=1 Tax=Mycobacterium aquaticum TaxID=1927124 RepID=UPI001301DC69